MGSLVCKYLSVVGRGSSGRWSDFARCASISWLWVVGAISRELQTRCDDTLLWQHNAAPEASADNSAHAVKTASGEPSTPIDVGPDSDDSEHLPNLSQHVQTYMLGNGPRDFWDRVDPADPKLVCLEDRLRAKGDWRSKAIPYAIHGDGAVFTQKDSNSMLTVSIKSLLSQRFKLCILPIFSIAKAARAAGQDDAVGILWSFVAHFLNAAFEGIHPVADPYGGDWAHGPLAQVAGEPFLDDRFFFVLWSITGDLEYLSNELRFPHFNSNSPCWFDQCGRSEGCPHPMTDVSLNASWKDTQVSAAEGCMVPISEHPIFSIIGANRWMAPGDLMHSGDLGVCSYVSGSVLEELCDEAPGPCTESGKVWQVWLAIRSGYETARTTNRVNRLERSMFSRRDDFPCFKGKAGETRSLLFILRDICRQWSDGSDWHDHRCRCLDSLCAMYSVLMNASLFPTKDESRDALMLYDNFLLHHNWLLKRSLTHNKRRYGFYFKFHHCWHIVHQSQWLNPCHTWCYEFEDFMSQVVAAGRACVAGSPMEIIGNKVLHNFC